MFCCSRKTLLILLAVAGLIGILMATGHINAYAVIPFLPLLLCPLMCAVMMMFGRKGGDGECRTARRKPSSTRPHVES